MTDFTHYKVGLIGFGSIGKRHCRNLLSLGIKDITLLREKGKGNEFGFKELYLEQEFFDCPFDFVIISNPTALHYSYLEKLIPLQVNLLVEKPVAATSSELNSLKYLLMNYSATGMCAYNLRFHPCVVKAKEIIDNQSLGKVYSARFFVGQYLPDWRPGTDYRSSYSSVVKLGGGVLLDLIHEIDLADHLCGSVKDQFHAITGKVSDLEIETEDLAEIHYVSSQNAFVSIHLDYLVKGYSRHFEIIGEKGRIFCDLSKNEISIIQDKNEITASYSFTDFDRNDMYLSLITYYLKNLKDNTQPNPTLENGLSSLKVALLAKQKSIHND